MNLNNYLNTDTNTTPAIIISLDMAKEIDFTEDVLNFENVQNNKQYQVTDHI